MMTELIEFHQGHLLDPKRLEVEESLLSNTPYLMEYLTIKREAELCVSTPSPSSEIRDHVEAQLFVKPPLKKHAWLTTCGISIGLCLATTIAFSLISKPVNTEKPAISHERFLNANHV